MKLRIGVVGQGRDWQSRYLPALRSMRDRFQVIGVYNSVQVLAESCARELEAETFTSFREMMESPSIEAVLVLENDWYRLVPLFAACELGKAIFCGSEIDLSSSIAADIRGRIQSSGVAFMTEFSRRFAPATLRLKELIATRLGTPRLLFCHRRLACESKDIRHAKSLESRSQRELLELIDWCNYIVGRKPNWVQAIRHSSKDSAATADYQIFSLGFGSPESDPQAILAQISCGAYIPEVWHEAITYRPPAAVQVCCEKGLAFVDLPSTLVWFDDAGRHQEALDTELSIGQQMFGQFHRAVTSLVRKTNDLDETCAALEILDLAKKSMGAQSRVPTA
ncbi:MAG: Gfo/Idh/MocA family oxidoreductase [Planctomycetes bacterium]|nr:Gfo/Idh/MocA family oxidoreductase [Planctomycetota bacterium]